MAKKVGAGRKLALKAKVTAADARERIEREFRERRPSVTLESVQRRLEIVIAALYGRTVAVAPLAKEATPTIEGETIRLPRALRATEGEKEALTRYRLFAIEQAERLARGTAAVAPADDALVRDLFLVREGAVIDAHIAQSHPGLRDTLTKARAAALAARPHLGFLSGAEREVEMQLRAALSDDVLAASQPSEPEASLAWARERAQQLRQTHREYWGVRPAQVWGTLPADGKAADWRREHARPIEHLQARMFSRGETEADSDASKGRTEKAAERYSANNAASAVREVEHNREASPSDPNERRELSDDSERSGREVAATATLASSRPDLDGLPPAVWFDEWDIYSRRYHKQTAGVRVMQSADGDETWASSALSDHAAVVRKVRSQFERLRARRILLARQRNGDEIDISAVVNAMTDRRLGRGVDDRLYMSARPARRGVATAILADASGSTRVPVSDGRAIMDLEKIALLLSCEALDALGDRYGAYTFAGKSAENVRLTCIKGFGDPSDRAVRRRIAQMAPSGFTRLGAAVRYVTAQLASQTAGHRMLLLLSDGRPNDMDGYQGDYAVEDSRQAILEARATGVYPFCLTIDAHAAEYLPRIFGASGHTIVTRPEQLPTALIGVVHGLLRKT